MLRGSFLFIGFVAPRVLGKEPNKDPDSFDIEPPLLIPNRDSELPPNTKAAPSLGRDVDLARLEKELERAKRSAAGIERLCKMGALSKLEAEQRALRLVHLEFDLANARLVCAKEEMLEKEKQLTAGEIAKAEIAQTEAGLAPPLEAAHAATVKHQQAELDTAEANVRRHGKLPAPRRPRKSHPAPAA